jgi:hypothetical protein
MRVGHTACYLVLPLAGVATQLLTWPRATRAASLGCTGRLSISETLHSLFLVIILSRGDCMDKQQQRSMMYCINAAEQPQAARSL